MYQTRKELEKTFQTAAAFYKLELAGRTLLCRSLAEIRRKGAVAERADALFVLLNPGQCLPSDAESEIPVLDGLAAELPLVKAEPDNTLRQLMRLMERMNWNYVKVINLTDIVSGKFREFWKTQEFIELHDESRHSLFNMERHFELQRHVQMSEKVVVGWGINPKIRGGAEEAYLCLLLFWQKEPYGIPHEIYPSFYHPFPWMRSKCIKWLDDMEQQLKLPVKESSVHIAVLH
ncbi:DUF1643 domain-containing protein [Planococcus sp. CAU13]|uniref:DUF1643 domain-containing protein n=1 Tax=Planococcus sp. CAU13 TaxID=1541197 RepID=UPI00052FF025|nr:DUF1643 domain-containing protein [Planococcus sp. CAU13]